MPDFTSLESSIVQALVSHISQNREVSLTALAAECHVAKATVIKAVKKLGYAGFDDFRHSIRFNAQAQDGILLPRIVTKGEKSQSTRELAECIWQMRDARNFIFSAERRLGSLLASYFSRKLALFDVFAPASYDYAFLDSMGKRPGFAMFCFHKSQPGKEALAQPQGYGLGMLQAAYAKGFKIIILTDDPEREHPEVSPLLIRVSDNELEEEDLFLAKCLMVFEGALAKFSAKLTGDQDD